MFQLIQSTSRDDKNCKKIKLTSKETQENDKRNPDWMDAKQNSNQF